MKILAISDTYIPGDVMNSGLKQLAQHGAEIVFRHWAHNTLIELQEANLAVEKSGPDALVLPQELFSGIEDYDILVTQFAPISRKVIEKAARLKVIAVLRGGTENIDLQAATERNILVLNTPGRNARAVAECTIGMMLSEVRNIARSHAAIFNGRWQREFPNSDYIPELFGKTVGLVGLGAIGTLVANYLRAFGSDVIAYDPYAENPPSFVRLTTLEGLAQSSDIISLHARLSKETAHLINEQILSLMKPSAVLINTARSGLVDETALIKALSERRIMGAALDVFEEEPLSKDSPFLKLDNVTLTPHLAGSTADAIRNAPHLLAGHLERLIKGEGKLPLINRGVPIPIFEG